VNLPPEAPDTGVERAEAKLAKLGVQVEAVQALLVRLLQDVVHAESRLESLDAARLVEVNEQLVVAAINSQVASEATSQALSLAADASTQDPLTGLPNRTALLDRFLLAIANTKRRGAQFGLLFVDLDGFKQLNDTYGHAFGDKVLHLTAERMLSVVREVDTVTRHGGDEFVILLAELTRPEDARTVAEKIVAAISAEAEIDGHAVHVTASVGIAIHPDHGEDFETLLSRADAAMYESKRRQPGGVVIYDASLGVAAPGAMQPPELPKRGGAVPDADTTNARLREANEKLVIAVMDAQELQAAAELARHQQTEFMKQVAAELLDPAAPIRIASAMLGRESGDQPQQPLLPLVEGIIEKQITEMSRIVDKIVDASTIEQKPLMLDRARVDFAGIVQASVVGHQAMFESRNQRFDMHLPAGALTVDGDAARLKQIIGNLLDNASRHTHNGGRIRLSVSTTPETLVLTVSDNGLGVTPQMLPYVFEPFVQDSHTLSLDGLGLGIGLTIARALTRAHGGTLVAYSAGANRGSQLVMTLPLASESAAPPPQGPPSESTSDADQRR
jgi:diguanylate cyclase (GGDEF)-like protein